MSPPAHTNRLAREKSPYLLQHQHNPVNWFSWGEAAFAKAREENKPIFLSIGYSTCHWCHVMERESFEDEALAKFLNDHFVSIKVDREERPDVDKIYMTFVQVTTGQGGWPLNVFLTPDLQPFFGGTYFPPDARHGRAAFLEVLQQLQTVWETRRGEIAGAAQQIRAHLEAAAAQSAAQAELTPESLQSGGTILQRAYDPRHGGFGGAPKFPQPSQPQMLLRYASRFQDAEGVRMVLHTCERMAAGGIHDLLGGGFSRYSVDAEWLVPHFEKMLYDNAQLAELYLDAYLISGQQSFATVARDILDYVLRDMTHSGGGFFSAEDADSEGHEGKFYCWTKAEMEQVLNPEEFAVARRYFGITDRGNFVDHSSPKPLPGQNVLSVVAPDLPETERKVLAEAKRKMFEVRSRRVRPHLDDKVLTSWNGLMLGTMARAGRVLDESRYSLAATKNLSFVRAHLWDEPTRTLFHRWREGERDEVQLLDAYAFFLSGLVAYYETSLESPALALAVSVAESMLARFFDAENGGFWQSTSSELILRIKENYDGAEPSGNSVATLALLKLGKITARKDFLDAAEQTLRFFSGRLAEFPQAMPFMLQALDFWLDEPRRVVIAGKTDNPATQALLSAAHRVYQPCKAVLGTEPPADPWVQTLPKSEGALAYVCLGNACQAPTADVEALKRSLSDSAGHQ